MAFKCSLVLGGELSGGETIVFAGWIEQCWTGAILEAGTVYALADVEGNRYGIATTFPCALLEKGELAVGDSIQSTTVIATAAADGEDIAYGKPYSSIVHYT